MRLFDEQLHEIRLRYQHQKEVTQEMKDISYLMMIIRQRDHEVRQIEKEREQEIKNESLRRKMSSM